MNKFLNNMNTEKITHRKIFEFYPGLMLIKTAPKEIRRIREFIIEKDNKLFLMDESFEFYDTGEIEFWQIVSNKGYTNLDHLCQDILMKKQLLIGLN
jgi:hypothetical protein